MPSPPPQPVPSRAHHTRSISNLNAANASLALAPGPSRIAASPMSYGAMTGISFANGGGFSFEGRATPRSSKWGGVPGSHGARFYGDASDSPSVFPTSITMESSSFAASSSAFHLPPPSLSSSYRRSYAAAARGGPHASLLSPRLNAVSNPAALSSSLASMSMSISTSYPHASGGMSFGTSYSKSQVHSLMAARSDAELTKAYECCGVTHAGLHALLEHVEDAHPFADPDAANPGFSPNVLAMDMDLDGVDDALEHTSTTGSTGSGLSPSVMPVPNYPLPLASSPEGGRIATSPAPLQISDVLTSPPEAESLLTLSRAPTVTSSCSSPPEGSLTTPTTSTHPSPVFAPPKLNPRTFLGSTAPRTDPKRFDRAFNEVVAGKKDVKSEAVAPGVLFASAVAGLGIPTTPPMQGPKPAEKIAAEVEGEASSSSSKLGEPALPQPSLFTTHKPWRCPNPGCNKAYKQSNGLKYHQQKGQCDFAIHDAVELGLSTEEAEERSRPFVCAVGAGCTKRYRQMNGLKYHYLNSGEHGQYGLRMIQNGTHPHPPSVPVPPPKRPMPLSNGTGHVLPMSAGPTSRPGATAPYTIPNAASRGLPRMGTFPTAPSRPITVTGIKTTPRPAPLPPIQKGRDAVLFSAIEPDFESL